MKIFLSLATMTLLFPQLLSADSLAEIGQPTTPKQSLVKKEISKGKEEVKKEFEYVEERGAKNPPGFFIAGDFLYWETQEDGLEYAVSGVASTANINAAKGKTYEPDFQWQPGFRIGAGLTLNDSLWDVGLFWTRLHSNVSDSVTASVPGSDSPSTRIFPILDHPGLGLSLGDVDSASIKWDLHYNTADLIVAREIKVNRFLYLRPLGGLRFAKIDQTYDVLYDYRAVPDNTTSVHVDNNFWGIGVRGGLDVCWQLYKMFSIFAKAGFTLFNGRFDIHQKNKLAPGASTPVATNYVNLSDRLTRVVPEMDVALGARFEMDFRGFGKEKPPHKHDKHYRFELLAGWEYVLYPRQNQAFLFTDATADGKGMRERGDLSFQGVTIGGLLHF